MTRSGPKLKAGERYASGALKPLHLRGQAPPPALVKRAVEAALRGAGDPRWGTVIGRLRLQRDLDDRQMGAAEAYGRLRGRFDRTMGFPRRSARSCLYEATAGRSAADPDEAEIAALRTEHARVLDGLAGGHRTAVMLDRIVLDDEPPLPGELSRLVAALDEVARLFRSGER